MSEISTAASHASDPANSQSRRPNRLAHKAVALLGAVAVLSGCSSRPPHPYGAEPGGYTLDYTHGQGTPEQHQARLEADASSIDAELDTLVGASVNELQNGMKRSEPKSHAAIWKSTGPGPKVELNYDATGDDSASLRFEGKVDGKRILVTADMYVNPAVGNPKSLADMRRPHSFLARRITATRPGDDDYSVAITRDTADPRTEVSIVNTNHAPLASDVPGDGPDPWVARELVPIDAAISDIVNRAR